MHTDPDTDADAITCRHMMTQLQSAGSCAFFGACASFLVAIILHGPNLDPLKHVVRLFVQVGARKLLLGTISTGSKAAGVTAVGLAGSDASGEHGTHGHAQSSSIQRCIFASSVLTEVPVVSMPESMMMPGLMSVLGFTDKLPIDQGDLTALEEVEAL